MILPTIPSSWLLSPQANEKSQSCQPFRWVCRPSARERKGEGVRRGEKWTVFQHIPSKIISSRSHTSPRLPSRTRRTYDSTSMVALSVSYSTQQVAQVKRSVGLFCWVETVEDGAEEDQA